MNIYIRKKRWKRWLILSAIIIVCISLWFTNILVKKIAKEERKKVQLWADAIQKKANLVKYTEELFKKLESQERKRIKLWADANKMLITANYSEDLTFYTKIISDNTTIPVILTDKDDNITATKNVDFSTDTVKILQGDLKKEFSVYEPIIINYYGNLKIYLYYKDSKLLIELRDVLNNLIKSFISGVVRNSASVPVIITDSTKTKVIAFGNIDSLKIKEASYIKKTISDMSYQNKPIDIELANYGKSYIFYKSSYVLKQLRYYPYIQFLIIGIFMLVAYLLFSTARSSEQSQVWTGMAKETAHQLGTPLSSLIAWVELLKLKGVDKKTTQEMEKDVKRLEVITERFSKIGSEPKLRNENIVKVLYNSIEYLKSRTSKRINYIINLPEDNELLVPLNTHLFEWVIENLCKNAVDAMSGKGKININIIEKDKILYIDVSDTGKGVPKSKYKTIFNPGYTSKSRGWGLGLSLSERIIQNYHSGKIFVKNSILNKGTTFRIVLKK